MNRRKFLVSGAAGTAAIVGLNLTGGAQAAAPGQAPAGERQGAAPGRGGAAGAGRGNSPAQVAPEKLARISLMTLNFNSVMKRPGTPVRPRIRSSTSWTCRSATRITTASPTSSASTTTSCKGTARP
jgi:hypothetical protein